MIKSGQSLSGRERNCAFLNTGGGTFATGSAVSGFDLADDSRGIALTDWDGDGRLDAWVSGRTAPQVRFLRNELEGGGDWVAFRLVGGGAVNRDAIGARIEVTVGSSELVRTLRAGDSFLSQSDKLLHFGLGSGEEPVEVVVVWPDGQRVQLGTVERNANYRVEYPEMIVVLVPKKGRVAWDAGEALPARPFSSEGAMRLVYPVPLPEIVLLGADGKRKILGKPGEGRFRLLNLWNPSCAGCEEELTALSAKSAALSAGQIEVVAALGPGGAGMVEALASLQTIGAPFAFGQLSAADTVLLDKIVEVAFAMSRDLVLPTSFLIGNDGKLEVIYLGAVSVDELLRDVALLRTRTASAQERARRLFGRGGHWMGVEAQANLMHVPLKLMEQKRVADGAAYVRNWSDLLVASKEYGRLLVWIADEKNKRGETREALVFYLNALKQGSEDPIVMNNVAWQMATHRDARVRDGAEAVRWAQKAVSLTGGNDPIYLDTLAAAYAETGNIPRALATVKEALRLAKDQKTGGLMPGLLKARQRYQAGMPLRDGK